MWRGLGLTPRPQRDQFMIRMGFLSESSGGTRGGGARGEHLGPEIGSSGCQRVRARPSQAVNWKQRARLEGSQEAMPGLGLQDGVCGQGRKPAGRGTTSGSCRQDGD